MPDRRTGVEDREETFEQPALDELVDGTELLHGQYRITRYLNSGGFGITYLATDSLNRNVVIKECFPSVLCLRYGQEMRARTVSYNDALNSVVDQFLKEAHSLAKLKHPNIVHVHQVFEENRTAYLAMDFIDGRDLQHVLEDQPATLAPLQVESFAQELLGAIKHVHDHGMLHRDISPDNILIDKSGRPILIDFGSARYFSGQTNRALSRIKSVKDGYSPQEFYIESSEQGTWSDIYSFAATLYHAVSGHPPEMGQKRLAELAAKRPDPYHKLTGRYPDYSPEFLAAIDKSLSVDPRKRIQTADEWLAMVPHTRIRSRERSAPQVAPAPAPIAPAPAPAPQAAPEVDQAAPRSEAPAPVTHPPEPRRAEAKARPALIGGVAAAALIVVVGGAYLALSPDESVPAPDIATAPVTAALTPTAPEPEGVALAAPAGVPTTFVVLGPVDPAIAPLPDLPTIAAAPAPGAPAPVAPPEAEVPVVRPAASAEPPALWSELAAPVSPEAAKLDFATGAFDDQALAVTAPVLLAAVALDGAPEPSAAPAPSTGPTKVATQQLAYSHWNVVMPFAAETERVRKANIARITEIAPDADLARAGGWIEEGVTIYALNGEVLLPNTPFSGHVLNALSVDPDGFSRATVRYRQPNNGDIDRGLLTVQVVREMALQDGTTLTASVRDLAWSIRVTDVPEGREGGLKTGDILVAERNADTKISTHEDLAAALDKLVLRGWDTAQFEVLRGGATALVDMRLARERAD